MNQENISFLLYGASMAFLIRNVVDYYHNAKYLNSDGMGAMINWHLGFLFAWISLCIGFIIHPGIRWFIGVSLLPGVFLSTYVIWFPTHYGLKYLGLIEKEDKNT